MSRKESITGGGTVRTQSVSGPPVQSMVKVAVLPPRLPENVAPPTGLGAADVFSWQESINWRHNEKIRKEQPKTWRQKAGLTTKRDKMNEDLPPFMFREVPYETWRKHYAKDKEGRYRGTEAPAEDCLLLPEDVAKWSFGPAETKADLWTRGSVALPVYDDTHQSENYLPAYTKDAPALAPPQSPPQRQLSNSTYTADGKSGEEIIAAAKAKAATPAGKQTWKDRIKRGTEFALLGAN